LLDLVLNNGTNALALKLAEQTIVIEHSSPNLFKPFHVGHTMNNVIGQAIVGLYKKTTANVVTISYPSDVSLGIGKAVWSLLRKGVSELQAQPDLTAELKFLGDCYKDGYQAYENDSDGNIEKQVRDITTEIYEQTPGPTLEAYKLGKTITLDYFKNITKTLGSEFDGFIYESEAGKVGREIVVNNTPNIFTNSDGAIVYQGEQDGLHTRVFINSAGYPTYEAKDLGLIKLKFATYKPDQSIVVTDAEQTEYFKVMLAAAGKINPDWQIHTKHISHGRMTFKGDRMSSRLGGIPTAEEVLEVLRERIMETSNKKLSDSDIEAIAIAALKFSILRSSPGSNVNFDPDTSLSFEGDSGPYLQYSVVRIASILSKATELNSNTLIKSINPEDYDLIRTLIRYELILEQSLENLAPQTLLQYLVQLAQEFNSYYSKNQIINDENIELTKHRIDVITRVQKVLIDGLQTLGVPIPSEM